MEKWVHTSLALHIVYGCAYRCQLPAAQALIQDIAIQQVVTQESIASASQRYLKQVKTSKA